MDRTQYFDILFEQVRCKRAVPYLKQEIEDHIEDQKEAFKAQGMNEYEAEMAAVKEMGDPVEAGMQLDVVHRPKMQWRLIVGIGVMSLMGLGIQLLITKGFVPDENTFWYLSTMSRQVLGILGGAVILFIAYFFDYTLLIKWSFPCWICLQLLIIYFQMFGATINGRSFHAMHAAYFVIPFFVGVVYRFRTQRWIGLLKSLACLCISVMTILMIPDISSAVTVAVSGLIVISAALYKKWYGIHVKKALLGIWGTVAFCGICAAVSVGYKISQGMITYRIARIIAWFTQREVDYIYAHVVNVAEHVKNGTSMDSQAFENIRNDYVWRYLFEYLGTWKGIVLILAFLVFMGILLREVMKEKNRLGYLIGIGCVISLAVRGILYIGMNFQLVPFAASYMPFVSHGTSAAIVTYFYMGILLSVFRNSNVVRN